ncbi:hydantoinase/oxoprolinase family protein [Defluviimonas sp. WL0024]|uniref:Hydantoinase/oxoprolinase family protein n=1 Tax=Albidovulum salinarum TaxID=2984153 RepID=A0ABT2XA79_9RHOB|nr:hydantoinase/oxoprolinase family protein [Defluviimonas sp. WL0024]MCU9849937.1 hydantoinase/oxoprolinase family protein [Defluviimonas sp. WL0024]
MAYLLGVDTGGTYTDAVILDEREDRVIASAKSLTTRPDLSLGVGRAIDAAIEKAGVKAAQVAMVSLSTTLATNALVEGQGGRVALVFIGFEESELARAGLTDALKGDPVIRLAGGHNHGGGEVAPLDLARLETEIATLGADITGFAVAASFATRNPAHENAARELIREKTGKPVTCSNELSAGLNGPRRALTAVLNARLIGMIDRLITACEAHMASLGIDAPLMVVRGDGALVSADLARDRPIETILSGPAASIAGASWLTGETDALVSDIGGTTTDVCLLKDGKPMIDPMGARVGEFRTMVEAVAMRTTGLGGDSELHLIEGLMTSLRLGPRRLVPVSLAARDYPGIVHDALDGWLALDAVGEHDGRFAIPMWRDTPPEGLTGREGAVVERLLAGPRRVTDCVRTRLELPALNRLVARGHVMIAGVTPSDAAHVLGRLDSWDAGAARKAVTLFARRRNGRGDRIAAGPEALAEAVIDQLTAQTVDCLLEAAFAEDSRDWGEVPEGLARHPLMRAGLDGHSGIVKLQASLGVPVIGLGASAPSYYGAVGDRVGTRMVLPEHAGVANAIGAVVGQIAMHAEGIVTSPGPGLFSAHLAEGPKRFNDRDTALAVLEAALTEDAEGRARLAGVEKMRITVDRELSEIEVEGQPMFIEARLRVTAQGRPRIAVG